MSSGDLCISCKQGKLRPFQLSATEAIVKCSNSECDSYLDFLPQENIVATAVPASTPSSRAVSRCSSPDSPALSQYSSTDLEVANLNKSRIQSTNSQKLRSHASQAFAPSKFPSSYHAPKSALPSIAKSGSHLTDAERCNIDLSTASLDDVDFFLDSLFGDIPSPKPSLPNSYLVPSHCSAFYQVPSVSQLSSSSESITKNDLSCFDGKRIQNNVESVYDKFSEVVKSSIALGSCRSSSVHDLVMLDENQFLSPSGSVVSEDSGYNDEIPTAVAVSGSGTRGGQAETKTTNSSMPAPVAQLGHETVRVAVTQTSSLAAAHVPKPECISFLSAPNSHSLQSSPTNTPFQSHFIELRSEPFSVNSSKSTDSSTSPDSIPLLAALLVPGSFQDSEPLSNVHLRPSCFQSTKEVVRHEETDSKTILSYAQLSLTNFLTIFEQNLATAISKVSNGAKTSHPRRSSGPIDSDKIIEWPTNLLVGEITGQISEECLSEQSESGGVSYTLAAEQHSSDSLRPTRVQSWVGGRPPKKKYKKRASNNSDIVQNESVDSVLSEQLPNIGASFLNPLVNNVLPTAVDDNSDSKPAVITGVPVAFINAPGEEPLIVTRIPSVRSSDGAPEVTIKRKYIAKRKIPEECPAPRKSARHQANPVESSRDTSVVRSSHNNTESQAVSSSSIVLPPSTLAHVRPSLAALLPPLPHHGHKHRCDGGRSNKRLKPSQPFRHLASNVNADPWAFPVILLDQLDIEVVVQGRPRKFTATHPIPKTEPPTQSTNVCVSSCDSRINGIVDGAILKSNHTSDVRDSVAVQMCIKPENCNVNKFSSHNLTDTEPCLVRTQSELNSESARKCVLDEPSGLVSVISPTTSVAMTDNSAQSSSYCNSFSNNSISVRVPSYNTASHPVCVSSSFPVGDLHLPGPKPLPLRVPLRQASAHQPVLAVAPLDRGIAMSNHGSLSPTAEKFDADGKLSNDSNGHMKLPEATSYRDNRNSNLNLLQKFVDEQTQNTTIQLQSLQQPLHKHRQSICIHSSNNLKPVNLNVVEVAESPVNLAMVKQEPGLSQLQPQSVHTFPSLQSFPPVGSIPQGHPMINNSHEPHYVVIQGQVYQVVQQAVRNSNTIIQVPGAGIIDTSQTIRNTSASQVSVLQVQPPLALNYSQQQYFMQQPLPPHHQPYPQQEYVAMHPPVRVAPGMMSSPQPCSVTQAVQQPGQPAVFCQAGPHSRPHATLSSVAHDTSASRASSLMTFVPETSVGQRSLPQSSSTSSRKVSLHSRLSEISTCSVLETGAVSHGNLRIAGDFSLENKANSLPNNLLLQSVDNCNVKYVMSPGDTSTELVPSRRNSNVLRSSCNSMPMNNQSFLFQSSHAKIRSSSPIPVSSKDLPFSPNDVTERAVFCSHLPLSSHPPSPGSSPSSPKIFPLLGTSPENSPKVEVISFDSPSSQIPHAHDLSTSPNGFPLDNSFANFVDKSPCIKVLNYSSSPSALMQLVLSEDESCSETSVNFSDARMKNNVPFHDGKCDPLCKRKLSDIDQEHSVACEIALSKFSLTKAPSLVESPQFSAAFPSSVQYSSKNCNRCHLPSLCSNEHTSTSITIPSYSFQMTASDCLVVGNHSYQTVHNKSGDRSLSYVGVHTSTNSINSFECSATVPLTSPFKSVFSDKCAAVLSQPCKTVNSLSIPKVSSKVQATLHPRSNYYQSDMACEDSFLLNPCVELIAVALEGLQCAQCNTDCWNKHALQLTNAAQLPNMIEVSGQCSSEKVYFAETAATGLSYVQLIEVSEEKISLQTTPVQEDCTYNFDSLTSTDPFITFSALAKSIDTPKYRKRKVRSFRVYGHKKAVTSYSKSQLCSEAIADKNKGECLKEVPVPLMTDDGKYLRETSMPAIVKEHTRECLENGPCQNRTLKGPESNWKNHCPTLVHQEAGRSSTSSGKSKSLVDKKEASNKAVHCTCTIENKIGGATSAKDSSEIVNQLQVESSNGLSAVNVSNVSSSISYSTGDRAYCLSNRSSETSWKKQRKQLAPLKFRSLDSESAKKAPSNKETILRESVEETRADLPHTVGRTAEMNTVRAKSPSIDYKTLGNFQSRASIVLGQDAVRRAKMSVEMPYPLLSKLTLSSSLSKPRNSSPLGLSTSVCASNPVHSNLILPSTPFTTMSLAVATSNHYSDEQPSWTPNLIPPSYSVEKSSGVTETMFSKELIQRPSIGRDLVQSRSTIRSVMEVSHRISPHIFKYLNDCDVDRLTKIQGRKHISDNCAVLPDIENSSQSTTSSNSNDQSSSVRVNIVNIYESCSGSASSSDAALLGKESYHKSREFRTGNVCSSVIAHDCELSVSYSDNKLELLPSLKINRNEQSVANSNNSYLTGLHVPPEESSMRHPLKTVDAKPPSSLAYLTVAKFMKRVSAKNLESFDEADHAEKPLLCDRATNASTSASWQLPSEQPVQLFTDTSNWWGSRQQAASDEVSLASSLQKDSGDSSEDEDAASVSSLSRPGRARSFTLVELPDDHHAYEELIASGYSVERPELKLPEGVKVLVSKEKRNCFKSTQRPEKVNVSTKPPKPVRKKLKTRKDAPKKVKETPLDCRKMAQEAVDNIVATRLPEDIPAMVIVSVKGKLFMYGSS